MERMKEAGHVKSGWTTLSAGLQELNSLTQIAEDGNSLQDKQWTPMGAGSMVPEEEEEEYSFWQSKLGRATHTHNRFMAL